MTSIIGIAGSTRKGSYNARLLRAAAALAPDGVTVAVASIADVPLYDGDLEADEGVPGAVASLKDRIAAADGLLLVTPEYNHSIPGVLKNAIDWLSRPTKDIGRVFGGRAVALAGATPGRGGTALAQAAWLPVLQTLGTRPWFGGQMLVPRAHEAFDDDGELADDALRERIARFVAGFAEFARGG